MAFVLPLALLIVVPLAQASDASLERALKAYKGRLTVDIAYLSNFSVPSHKAAATVLHKLSKVRSDLSGARRAATHQQASSSSARKGQALVLSALRDVLAAESDAHACAAAVRSADRAAAKRDQAKEQSEVNKAIPLFESGGKLLHLF